MADKSDGLNEYYHRDAASIQDLYGYSYVRTFDLTFRFSLCCDTVHM